MGISLTYGFIDSSPTLDTNGILYIGASDGSIVALTWVLETHLHLMLLAQTS